MTSDYTPQPVMKLTDLEAVKVLSDPKRLDILETIHLAGHALSVKQMAEQLKVDPRKLYYHIKLLEQHGILVVTDIKIVSNIAEKFYHVAAYTFDVAPTVFSANDDDENPMQEALALIFDHTKSELIRSAQLGLLKHDDDPPTSNIGRASFRLNSEEISDFLTKLHELIYSFDKTSDGSDKDKALYLFSFAFFPTETDDFDRENDDVNAD